MSANQPITSDAVEYRDVAEDPGYRVGSDGTFWSSWTGGEFGKRSIGSTWRQLKGGMSRGYPQVCYRNNKKRYIHRVVLETFVGPCPPGMEACHKDGNPANCRLDNLRWDTRKGNHADKKTHGTMACGEKNGWAKLTPEAVRAIRREYATGHVRLKDLGDKHGVDLGTIHKIVTRKSWKHVA